MNIGPEIKNQIITFDASLLDGAFIAKLITLNNEGEPKSSDYAIIKNRVRVLNCETNVQAIKESANRYGINYKFSVCEEKNIPKANKVKISIKNGFKLRGYQSNTVKTTLDMFKEKFNPNDITSMPKKVLVDLEPGAGKGFICNSTLARLGARPVFLLKPTYIKKWILELKEHFRIDDDEILLVNKLADFIENDYGDISKYKIVIMSTNLITKIRNTEDPSVIGLLENFMDRVKSSVMVNDETHQHFDAVLYGVLMLNPKLLLCMTATLVSNDNDTETRQTNLMPEELRLSFKAPDPYIHYDIVTYTIRGLTGSHTDTNRGYNHHKLEDILSSDNNIQETALLITSIISNRFFNGGQYQEGDKVLVYFSSISLIHKMEKVMREIAKKSPRKIRVGSYTGASDYEDIFDMDIILTTPGKAGTAIDIPGLLMVLNTVNIGSYQMNLQMPGRLRRRDGRELFYIQTVCLNIPKHIKYVKAFLSKFANRFKAIRQMEGLDRELRCTLPNAKGSFRKRNRFYKRR